MFPFGRQGSEGVHADNRQQPRNRVEQPDLDIAQVAHLLDDARQPEGRGVDGQLDKEVDQAEQDDLAILEQFAQRRLDGRGGFPGQLFVVDGLDQCVLLFAAQPFGVVGPGVQPEPDEHAQPHRKHALDEVHPLPAMHAQAADLQE
ncbi:hypothetical protein D3C85_876160 [compost metagenome]